MSILHFDWYYYWVFCLSRFEFDRRQIKDAPPYTRSAFGIQYLRKRKQTTTQLIKREEAERRTHQAHIINDTPNRLCSPTPLQCACVWALDWAERVQSERTKNQNVNYSIGIVGATERCICWLVVAVLFIRISAIHSEFVTDSIIHASSLSLCAINLLNEVNDANGCRSIQPSSFVATYIWIGVLSSRIVNNVYVIRRHQHRWVSFDAQGDMLTGAHCPPESQQTSTGFSFVSFTFDLSFSSCFYSVGRSDGWTLKWTVIYFYIYFAHCSAILVCSVRLASSSASVARYQFECSECTHNRRRTKKKSNWIRHWRDSILFSLTVAFDVLFFDVKLRTQSVCACTAQTYAAQMFCWSGRPFVFVWIAIERETHRLHHCKGFISITLLLLLLFLCRFHFHFGVLDTWRRFR